MNKKKAFKLSISPELIEKARGLNLIKKKNGELSHYIGLIQFVMKVNNDENKTIKIKFKRC